VGGASGLVTAPSPASSQPSRTQHPAVADEQQHLLGDVELDVTGRGRPWARDRGDPMIALANAMTMSILERTRETGILRNIGARARDIRRIFATEGIAVAVVGWMLGIHIGYALDTMLVWLVHRVVHLQIQLAFPAGNILLALVATTLLAAVVIVLPLRRATHLKPGDALRYA
jgi:hypothetical protein